MKRNLAVALVLIVVIVALAFMVRFDIYVPAVTDKQVRIAAVLYTENNPFWISVWKGVRKATADLKLDLTEYHYEKDEDAEDMLEIAIIAEVDAIILRMDNATSQRTKKMIFSAKEKGIHIVIIDTKDYVEYSDASVSIDNEGSSVKLAHAVIEQYQQGKSILMMRLMNSSSTTIVRQYELYRQFSDAGLSKNTNFLILPTMEEMRAKTLQDYLLNNIDIGYIVCTGPKSTLIAAKTIENMGLVGKVKVAGFCETEEAFDYVQSGIISSLIVQKTFDMGYTSALLAGNLALGKEPDSRTYQIDTLLVKIDNIQDGIQALRWAQEL